MDASDRRHQPPSRLLDVAVDKEGDHARVAPSGEIDMATTPTLATILDELIHDEGAHRVTVDLHGVTFLDSTGLHLLANTATSASRDGFDFEVARVPRHVREVFVICGVDQLVPVVDS